MPRAIPSAEPAQEVFERPDHGYGIIGRLLKEMEINHRDQLKALLRRNSLKRGTFTLASGRISNYYLDCKLTTLHPEGAVLTGYTILELLDRHGIQADAIGGPTIGADPIVTAVAAVSYLEQNTHPERNLLPAFIVRKDRKTHGCKKQIEGIDLSAISKVVVVDEVCTTGESTLEALDAVEREGLEVVAVVSLVDREEGGSEKLRQKYLYFPIFTAKELLEEDGQSSQESGQTEGTPLQSIAGGPRTA